MRQHQQLGEGTEMKRQQMRIVESSCYMTSDLHVVQSLRHSESPEASEPTQRAGPQTLAQMKNY